MHIHIAIYRWRDDATEDGVRGALREVEALAEKVPGIVDISTGVNLSKFGEGYTHAILVRGDSQEAIDAYRAHPDHGVVAKRIEEMEAAGIGVDFATD